MSRPALRRAVGLSVLLIVLSFALGYLRLGGTFALWTGETANTSSPLEAGWVGPATGLGTPAPTGYGASLAWTPGTHGPVTGQKVYAAPGGTGATASCGTYALDATLASATTASYTTTGSSANNGAWRCYQVVSTSATAWTATATFTPIRVGLYPVSVALANGGTSGALDSGDTIAITFNQNIGAASGTSICAVAGASGTGVVLIGDSTCSGSGDATTVGKLTGLTVGGTGAQPVAVTASTSTNKVTVTVGATGPTVSGTATFTASASVTSSVGSAAACTSASAPTCVVSATGGF